MKFKLSGVKLRYFFDVKLTSMLKNYHDDDTCWVRYNQHTIDDQATDLTYIIDVTYRINGDVRNVRFPIGGYDKQDRVVLTGFLAVENDHKNKTTIV